MATHVVSRLNTPDQNALSKLRQPERHMVANRLAGDTVCALILEFRGIGCVTLYRKVAA